MKPKKMKPSGPFGDVPIESVFFAAGFCVGLAERRAPVDLSNYERRILRLAGKAMMHAAQAARDAEDGRLLK